MGRFKKIMTGKFGVAWFVLKIISHFKNINYSFKPIMESDNEDFQYIKFES